MARYLFSLRGTRFVLGTRDRPIHRPWPNQRPISSRFGPQNGSTRSLWCFQGPISKIRLLKSEQIHGKGYYEMGTIQ